MGKRVVLVTLEHKDDAGDECSEHVGVDVSVGSPSEIEQGYGFAVEDDPEPCIECGHVWTDDEMAMIHARAVEQAAEQHREARRGR